MIVNKDYSCKDTVYKFFQINISTQNIEPFIGYRFDYEIIAYNSKKYVVGPHDLKVVKEIQYLGTVENFKDSNLKLLTLSSTSYSDFVNTSDYYSYVWYYQKIPHPKTYAHMHKKDIRFKLYQSVIRHPISKLDNNVLPFKLNRKPLKLFDVRNRTFVRIHNQCFTPYYKLPSLFKTRRVYSVSPLILAPLTFNWMPAYIKDFKANTLMYINNKYIKYDLEIFVKKKDVGNKKVLDNIYYTNNTADNKYRNLFNTKPSRYFFTDIKLPINTKPMYGIVHYHYNPRRDLNDKIYGYFSQKKMMYSSKTLLFGPIEVVRTQIDPNKSNSFKTYKPRVYPLCHINNRLGSDGNLKGFTICVGTYATPKDVTGITVKAIDYVIPEIEWANTKDYVSPALYYVSVYQRIEYDVAEENFGYATLIVHKDIITIKDYAYRDINFNKISTPLEGVVYYRDNWARIAPTKYKNLMSTEKLLFEVSYVKPFKYKSMFTYEKVYRINGYKKIFKTGWAQDLLSYKDKLSELIFLRNGSIITAVISQQSSNGIVKTYSDILRYSLVFNNTYTKNAWILKTKKDGTYDWEKETVQRACNYFLQDDVIEATEFFTSIGVYPFGVKHLLNLEYKNDLKAYIDIREETRFGFSCGKTVTIFLDLAPISKTLEKTKFKKFERGQGLKGTYMFDELSANMFYVDNHSETNLIQINTFLFKYHLDNYLSKNTIVFDKINLAYKQEWFIIEKDEKQAHNRFLMDKYYSENTTESNESLYESFSESVFHFTKLYFGVDLNKYEMQVDAHIEVPIADNNNYELQAELLLEQFHSNTDAFYLCEFLINIPQDIQGATYKFNETTIDIINNKKPDIMSKQGDIYLNTTLHKCGVYVSKYGIIWAQLFFPTKTKLASLAINMFNFFFEDFEWKFIMPFNYYYVDDHKIAKEKGVAKKGFKPPPGLEWRWISSGKKRKVKPDKTKKLKPCFSIYKQLDYDGFDFALERDDKLLIGNNLYDRLEIVFDYNIDDVKSIFVDGRNASSLGALSKSAMDILKSKIDVKTDKAFDIENFALKSKDFNGAIAEDKLRTQNTMISNAIDKIVNAVPLESKVSNLEQLIKQYPEYKENIKKQMDQARNPSDLYVWKNVPARRPLDFVLAKSVHVREGGATFVRKPKES